MSEETAIEDPVTDEVPPGEVFDAPQPEPEAPSAGGLTAQSAFIVYQTLEGHWVASTDLQVQLAVQRAGTLDDIYHGACDVKCDIEASKVAQNVLTLQMQAAQRVAQQQQQAEIARQVLGAPAGGIDLSHLRG